MRAALALCILNDDFNEILKEHRTVEELKKEIAALTAIVKEQASQIQKVSAQLEVSKSAPRVVSNDQ
jgi:predicted RNase H-like nuclease (RuvC/YqgF family)